VTTVQYRVVFGKKDEAIAGPDDADVVITVPAADATSDPAVAFMRGRLKAAGSTARLIELFRSGEAAAQLTKLAAREPAAE
jgi:hypothetical protein